MKTIIVVLLSLLVIVHGTSDETAYDEFASPGLGELGSLDTNEDDEIEGFVVPPPWEGKHCVVNVDSFGAFGDGVHDDTKAFTKAWNKACSTPRSVFLVPKERRYLVKATIFNGPCVDRLIVNIGGTIVAPSEIKKWNPRLIRIWLAFNNLTDVLFTGNGVIDGSGSNWWAASCKRNKTKPCTKAPTALTIDNSSAIIFRDLTIRNSQQFHFTISRSDSVRVCNVLVTAPADSPNTDGIHISNSTNVVLRKCKIRTGDDCISIIAGSSNIKMKSIHCGPGHGISIGSLGKDNATDFVHKIHLNGASFRNTTNGLRIKSWQGGSGYAKHIRFENVIMEDVKNPIIIDQFYCDSTTPCKNQTSAVEISHVKYKNIIGFTKSEVAMKFACSDTLPCKNIDLINIALLSKNGTVYTFCNSALVSEVSWDHTYLSHSGLRIGLLFFESRIRPMATFSMVANAEAWRAKGKETHSRNAAEEEMQEERWDFMNSKPLSLIGDTCWVRVIYIAVDASWKEGGRAGYRWVFTDNYRDQKWHLGGSTRGYAESPTQAEAIGAIKAMEWAKNHNMLHVILLTDCLSFILQIAGTEDQRLDTQDLI